MADYVIPENLAVAIGVVATAAAGVCTKVAVAIYKNKNDQISALQTKVETLQAEIKGLLMAQIEAEPARRAALDKIGVTMADQNQMIRDLLTKLAKGTV